ncbi:MAG: hypothetical protein ACXVE4_13245 [Solirubrobacteraceae bacterium]
MEISARRTVPVSPAAAFAFLSHPHNHHRLVTSRIRLLELELTRDGELHGGLMRLHGPLGLRRRARTRLGEARRSARLAGTARVGSSTDVGVRWDLRAAGADATVVVLTATVTRLAATDRMLLRLGWAGWAGAAGSRACLRRRLSGWPAS